MADNVLNAVVDDFVGHRDRLLRIAGVVIFDGHQLVALNAAAGVDVFNRLTRAIEPMSPHWATGPDIAPTTATLISLAIAACDIANATMPATMVFAFLSCCRTPFVMWCKCFVFLWLKSILCFY